MNLIIYNIVLSQYMKLKLSNDYTGLLTSWFGKNFEQALILVCEQRWRSGKSTRLPPMRPGFDFQTRRYMDVGCISAWVLLFSPLIKKPAFDSI